MFEKKFRRCLKIGEFMVPNCKRDRIKAFLLGPRSYWGCDVLIEKFTKQNVSLNAAIEENAAIEDYLYSNY